MNQPTRIAVILASYNGAKYIVDQVLSILNQKHVDVQILIFDDNSTDNTLEVLKKFEIEERVTIVRKVTGSGSAAKNFFYGLTHLDDILDKKVDFIAFSDQDDVWLENKLYRAISKLRLDKAELYMSNLSIWKEGKEGNQTLKKSANQKKYDFLFEGGSAGCTYVLSPTLLNLLINNLNNLYFDRWTYLSHDWLVYFVARINKMKVYIDNESHILYRIHENNVHGHMNTVSFRGVIDKLDLVRRGWYFNHINGFKQLLPSNSEELYIYDMYVSNIFTRVFVLLKYNFDLIRDKRKFVIFFILSLFPIKNKYK